MSLPPPPKVRKLQTALHTKAKESPDYRFYALYDKARGRPAVDGRRPAFGRRSPAPLPGPPSASSSRSRSPRLRNDESDHQLPDMSHGFFGSHRAAPAPGAREHRPFGT